MSLLKLRTTTLFLHAHRLSLTRHLKCSRNESIVTVSSSAGAKHLFHSISRNNFDNILSPVPVSPSVGRRNLSESNNTPLYDEPFSTFALRVLTESPIIENIENYIIQFHDLSGLHWWSSIITMTFITRLCCTFPLTVYQHIIYARLDAINQEMNKIVEKLKLKATLSVNRLSYPPKLAQKLYQRSVKKEYDKLVLRDNCHPLKGTFVIIFQLPIWIYLSAALRNIVSGIPQDNADVFIAIREMSVGGPFWCQNLLYPDPTFILPICLGLTNLAIMELQVLKRYTGKESLMRRIGTNAFRLVSLVTVPIAMQMPAVISLYWLSSSMFGLTQNLVLLLPKVRRACRIPQTPVDLDHPFQFIGQKFVERNTAFKNKVQRIFKL